MRTENLVLPRRVIPRSVSVSLRRLRNASVLPAALAAYLCAAGPVVAQESEGSSGAAETTVPSDAPAGSEKICRYEEVTGSRMRKRVCQTAERWEARERTSKNLMRELDGRPVKGYVNEGGG